MKKGKKIGIIVAAVCFVAAGVVFGTGKMSTVSASYYGTEDKFQFEDTHMQNIYQSDEKTVDGQKQTQKTIEIYVSKKYAGDYGKIYVQLSDYTSGKFVSNAFATREREENGGYIYVAKVWENEGTRLKGFINNCTNYDYIIDYNGGHGYELNF